MAKRTYFNFSEVEKEVIEMTSPIVYKYRTWTETNHKNLLINNDVWFSHPYDLNDPLDVRPELVYSLNEIQSIDFFYKLLNSIPREFQHLEDYQKVEIAERQWELIKCDPDNHFNNNRKELLIRERFNQYGVFSTSTDCLNLPTWELYGDNLKGNAIGFTTVELARQLNCSMKTVAYSDDPFPYSFLGNQEDVDILFYKKKFWEYEKEFRFITLGIDIYRKRLVQVKRDTVAEVILGCDISIDNQNEIMKIIENEYPSNFPVYKITKSENGIFERIKIN